MNLVSDPQCATITKRETIWYHTPPDGNSTIHEGLLPKDGGERDQTSIYQLNYRKYTEQRSRLGENTGVQSARSRPWETLQNK